MGEEFGGRTRLQCAARGCEGCLVCEPEKYHVAPRAMGECLHSLQCDDCSKARRTRHPAPRADVEALVEAISVAVLQDKPGTGGAEWVSNEALARIRTALARVEEHADG